MARTTTCGRGLILRISRKLRWMDHSYAPTASWGLTSTPPGIVNETDEHDDNNDEGAIANRDSQGTNTNSGDSSYVPLEASSSVDLLLATWLPSVSVGDLDIMDPIGHGINGAVFCIRWKGQKYALKQFRYFRCNRTSKLYPRKPSLCLVARCMGCSRAKARVPLQAWRPHD
eukprot:scaffold46056_cov48-Attheya_sp.AAC.2